MLKNLLEISNAEQVDTSSPSNGKSTAIEI
jgi:hypothetical protein